jgi:hypothetical protein
MSEYAHRIHRLSGTPYEIGHVMGQTLGAKLDANIERYVRERVPHNTELDVDRWRSGALPWLRSLPARFQEEFEGLAAGARLPLQRLAEWAYLEIFLGNSCSGAIIRLGQSIWVARNNDTFAPGMWGYVTMRQVTGRIPTISFGMEGDVFTPTGINQARLWLHYNYLPAWDAPDATAPHLPGYALMVEALETCRTLQDVEALLRRIQRDDGMLLFAVDGKTNTAALYECTCTDVHKRKLDRRWLVGTNHYRFHPEAPPLDAPSSQSTVRRCKRLNTLVKGYLSDEEEKPPVDALIQMLADDGVEVRKGEIVTAYANVACPATREIWYTFGGYPAASQGNWQRLAWPW